MSQQTGLKIWIICFSPSDFPGEYVARMWLGGFNPHQTALLIRRKTLEELREIFRGQGLAMLSRHPDDDPVIVETWL